eukprot:GHVS01057163.1.p1 GENE.GHVS01057163.1~~GHVS01057163.1.p1  ORF type:complete len:229 (-),score=49.76 GHVS01057163.1:122-808(-)
MAAAPAVPAVPIRYWHWELEKRKDGTVKHGSYVVAHDDDTENNESSKPPTTADIAQLKHQTEVATAQQDTAAAAVEKAETAAAAVVEATVVAQNAQREAADAVSEAATAGDVVTKAVDEVAAAQLQWQKVAALSSTPADPSVGDLAVNAATALDEANATAATAAAAANVLKVEAQAAIDERERAAKSLRDFQTYADKTKVAAGASTITAQSTAHGLLDKDKTGHLMWQ